MEHYPFVNASIGGILIGISAALLLWANGRIAGVSGIAGQISLSKKGDLHWRTLFLIGLILGVILYRSAGGSLIDIEINPSFPTIIVAGFLTGLGTKMGNGCTSGHGICGIAQRSIRSILAVAIFLSVAVMTVFITNNITNLL